RQVDLLAPAEFLPGGLEARMLGSLQRLRPAERYHPAAFDLCQCETGVSPTDVGDRDLSHACSASIASSIADAPSSASPARIRISANSSRPVPAGGGGELAG